MEKGTMAQMGTNLATQVLSALVIGVVNLAVVGVVNKVNGSLQANAMAKKALAESKGAIPTQPETPAPEVIPTENPGEVVKKM